MLFAALILEREPPRWSDLPALLVLWTQNVGALAALGALLWFVILVTRTRGERRRLNAATPALMALAASWIGFLLVGAMFILYWMGATGLESSLPTRRGFASLGDWLMTGAGALALITVLTPVLLAVVLRFRWGRIWAMARLSLKEAIRSRVVLIFGAMALIFLFADWFVPYKPEDQVRNYVRVLYWSMTPLFLMTASLLGAFGIPTDVKNQSIHTIVTKPVEKFEVVLGRFLGYAIVVTAGLAVVTGASMLYVVRGVTEEAKRESYTARVPVYAQQLVFVGTERATGDNVGRIFDYRGYIAGPQPSNPNAPRQYAVFAFDEIPAEVAERSGPARFEFTFDVFRLTKGEENRGVFCTFVLMPGQMTLGEMDRTLDLMRRERDRLLDEARRRHAGSAADFEQARTKIESELLEKFPIYEVAGVELKDYHTLHINVPTGLLKRVRELAQAGAAAEENAPVLQVAVSVDRNSQQMIGMARFDFFLLAGERSFLVNFVKGIIGMWCLTMLVLGVAVACSTYLSGVISWLLTVFLLIAGMFVADIQALAENRSEGGGPIESAVRLLTRSPMTVPLDDTPVRTVVAGVDEIYRFWLRRFLNMVPDVSRYDLHEFVGNGFDISWTRVLLLGNVVPLVGYLLPCAVLAFYLMRYREIANPT